MKLVLLISIFLFTACGFHPPSIEGRPKEILKVTHKMPKEFDLASSDLFKRISCNECHEKLNSKFVHEAAKTSCLSCHTKHIDKGRNKNFLRSQTNSLCIQCHKKSDLHNNDLSIKNHPVGKKVKCIDCHDPHESKHGSHLIRFNYNQKSKYKDNMCAHCHWSISNDK